jgi:hypothetical protein
MKKEYCKICWYCDKEHKSCGNATCPNFSVEIKNPDTFACMWFEPEYKEENERGEAI